MNNKLFLPIVGFLTLVVLVSIGAFIFLNQPKMTSTQQPSRISETKDIPSPSPIPKSDSPVENLSTQIPLVISSPINNQELSTPTLNIIGKTSPLSDVTINDKEVKSLADGTFKATLTLEDGLNYILVTSTDSNGNYSEKEITVSYNNPANL